MFVSKIDNWGQSYLYAKYDTLMYRESTKLMRDIINIFLSLLNHDKLFPTWAGRALTCQGEQAGFIRVADNAVFASQIEFI